MRFNLYLPFEAIGEVYPWKEIRASDDGSWQQKKSQDFFQE